jgi:hypothetical protein
MTSMSVRGAVLVLAMGVCAFAPGVSAAAGPAEREPAAAVDEEAALDAALALCDQGRTDECLAQLDALATDAQWPRVRTQARTIAARMRTASGPATPVQETAPQSALPDDVTPTDRDEGGRILTLTTAAALGLSLYGPTMLILTEPDDGRTAVGLYMLTAGVSFAVPYALSSEGVPWGAANLGYYGGTRGALHGMLLAGLLGGTETTTKGAFGGAMGLSVLEGALGIVLGESQQVTPGEANAIGVGNDIGMFLMAMGWVAAADSVELDSPRGPAATMLVGAAAGAFGGLQLAHIDGLSWGDAETIRTAAILGGFAGGTIYAFADPQPDSATALGSLLGLGAIAGAVVGERLVVDRELSAGRAQLIELATYAGALAGAGTVFLLGGDAGRDYLTGLTIGGAAGFGLVFAGARDAPVLRRTADWLEQHGDILSSLQVGPAQVGPHTMGVSLGAAF